MQEGLVYLASLSDRALARLALAGSSPRTLQHNQHQKLKRIAAFSQSGALANGAVPRSTFVLFNVCTTQESK